MRGPSRTWISVIMALGFVTVSLLTMTRMYLDLRQTWQETTHSSLILDLAHSDIQWIRLQLQDSDRLNSAAVEVRIDQAVERYTEALRNLAAAFPQINFPAVETLPELLPLQSSYRSNFP